MISVRKSFNSEDTNTLNQSSYCFLNYPKTGGLQYYPVKFGSEYFDSH